MQDLFYIAIFFYLIFIVVFDLKLELYCTILHKSIKEIEDKLLLDYLQLFSFTLEVQLEDSLMVRGLRDFN